MRTKTQGVYVFLNTVNGKVYVGSSGDVVQRKTRHVQALRAGKHRNVHFQSSFNLHSELAFEFAVLERVKNSFWLRAREHAWISRLQAANREFGYNIAEDPWSPLGGVHFSKERRARLSAATKAAMGKPEVRRKCSESAKRRFNNPKELQRWKEARKALNTVTRINNTRYLRPEEHERTAQAAKLAHIEFKAKYVAAAQKRSEIARKTYLKNPKLCAYCDKPLPLKPGVRLSQIKRYTYCSRSCGACAREKRRHGK
jgi:group I intron endonuclease